MQSLRINIIFFQFDHVGLLMALVVLVNFLLSRMLLAVSLSVCPSRQAALNGFAFMFRA